MFINEYGDKSDPHVLFLAPMMVSGEDLYQLMHPKEYAEEIKVFSWRNRNVLG